KREAGELLASLVQALYVPARPPAMARAWQSPSAAAAPPKLPWYEVLVTKTRQSPPLPQVGGPGCVVGGAGGADDDVTIRTCWVVRARAVTSWLWSSRCLSVTLTVAMNVPSFV